jgi:hypothetical protein
VPFADLGLHNDSLGRLAPKLAAYQGDVVAE